MVGGSVWGILERKMTHLYVYLWAMYIQFKKDATIAKLLDSWLDESQMMMTNWECDDDNNIVGGNGDCQKSDYTTLARIPFTTLARIIHYLRVVLLVLSKKENKGQKRKHFTTSLSFASFSSCHENVTPKLPFYSEPDCFHCAVEESLFQKKKESRESRHTVLPPSTFYVYTISKWRQRLRWKAYIIVIIRHHRRHSSGLDCTSGSYW
jgi:hypothetical protein